MVCGFWAPEKNDIKRIRKEFEVDALEVRSIVNHPEFKHHFGQLKGDELKTAPRGFDKAHPDMDLIKKKQWIVTKEFTDSQILAENFASEVDKAYQAIRPFFDYMSDVLTTDLNGTSLL